MAEMTLVKAIGIRASTETENMIETAFRVAQSLEYHKEMLDRLERLGPGSVDPEEVGQAWTKVLFHLHRWRLAHHRWSQAFPGEALPPFPLT